MECFTEFYERLEALTALPINNKEVDVKEEVITVDISNPEITIDYFNKVDYLSSILVSFYEKYIANAKMHQALHGIFNTHRRKNYDDLKLSLMVDVVRAYEGLDHSTSLQTPEGIALLMLLVKLFRPDYFINYPRLYAIPEDIINLDGIVPYISACSDEMSTVEEGSVISLLLIEVHPKSVQTYRKCLYYLFEAVSNADGVISTSEKEYLMELLNLNDDDVNNDINVESSIDLK